MRWFESCRPSQPVRSPLANRHRGIPQILLGLRNWAVEVLFRPVSEDHFWCLFFWTAILKAMHVERGKLISNLPSVRNSPTHHKPCFSNRRRGEDIHVSRRR